MNKTLSLIEEELEEDFATNEEYNDQYNEPPTIVRDIENIEREFTKFLEMIYN